MIKGKRRPRAALKGSRFTPRLWNRPSGYDSARSDSRNAATILFRGISFFRKAVAPIALKELRSSRVVEKAGQSSESSRNLSRVSRNLAQSLQERVSGQSAAARRSLV